MTVGLANAKDISSHAAVIFFLFNRHTKRMIHKKYSPGNNSLRRQNVCPNILICESLQRILGNVPSPVLGYKLGLLIERSLHRFVRLLIPLLVAEDTQRDIFQHLRLSTAGFLPPVCSSLLNVRIKRNAALH